MQLQRYPELQIQDLFKFIYQSAFGCEHLVSDEASVKAYLLKEAGDCVPASEELVLPLDGEYCRVHLDYLRKGLSADTFARLFVLSGKPVEDGECALKEKLEVLRELVLQGELPFSVEELDKKTEEWRQSGYPACHHSEQYRRSYAPAYRLLKKEYALFLPLFAKLDAMMQKGRVILAVEGGSASGKTTLAGLLQQVYDATVFHMDDFFLRPEQRTPERFAEPGGNVDRERFQEEVLQPFGRGEAILYRPFDCRTFSLGEPVRVEPGKLVVVEGAYSMHPELRKYYDVSLFLDVSPVLQRKRIKKRNSPELAKRFFEEWIPMEQRYFEELKIKEQCDMCVKIGEV